MKTRVVWVGPFRRHGYAHHWRGVRLGMEAIGEDENIDVEYLDFRELVGSNPYDNEYESDQAAVARLRDCRPDVVIFGVQDAMTDAMLDAAKEIGAFTCLWFCDVRYPVERDLVDRLDFLVMTNQGFREMYSSTWGVDDIVWLPQGCIPMDAPADPDPEFETGIVHVGSWSHPDFHESRRQVFEAIVKRYGATSIRNRERSREEGLDGKIRATFWNPTNDIERAFVTRQLPVLYSSAKLAVGVSDPIPGYHSNRIFLATGMGSAFVCNHYQGIEHLFEPGKEVIPVVGGPEDFLAAIDFYLADDQARNRVRAAAFRRSQSDHNYLVRIREFWDMISRRR